MERFETIINGGIIGCIGMLLGMGIMHQSWTNRLIKDDKTHEWSIDALTGSKSIVKIEKEGN